MDKTEPKTSMGNQLLSLEARSTDSKEQYRKEMSAMLKNEEKNLRLVRRINVFVYFFLIFLSVTFLVSMSTHNFERKMEFGIIGIVVMIIAGIVMIPMTVIQTRFEILKEIKELQLRIVELGEKLTVKK